MRAVRGRQVMLIGLVLLLIALVMAVGIGSVHIPPKEVLAILFSRVPGFPVGGLWPDAHALILWQIRLPRVVMAAVVGAALAVGGAAYQGLFRNPLADPYVLGVSSGAALGAALAIAFVDWVHRIFPLPQLLKLGPVPIFAFIGGLGAVGLVYYLASSGERVPVVGLLLAGVAVGSFSIAMVSLVIFLTKPQARDAIIFWLMGGLGNASWAKVGILLPYVTVGVALLLFHGRQLNAMLMGEEAAHNLGVEVERLKRRVLVAGSLLTAAAVAFCGAIGFVGLIVPHLVRILVGPDHRYLLPASALVGAILLIAADTVARSILPATELPVGLVMAAVGGPFFLWLLRRKLRPVGG
jgi:iron complex transport system permease protein